MSRDTCAFVSAVPTVPAVRLLTNLRMARCVLCPSTTDPAPILLGVLSLDFPPLMVTSLFSWLTVFSKAVHFVLLSKLSTASETAGLLVLNVFSLHGIPLDIVSDCRPQFSSQVWKTFCQALGTMASLSSGYHP